MKKIRNLIKLFAVVIVVLFFSCSDNNEGVTGNEISTVETTTFPFNSFGQRITQ